MLFYILTFPLVLPAIVIWGMLVLSKITGESVAELAQGDRPDDIFFCSAWLGISIVAGLMTLSSHFLPVTPLVVIVLLGLTSSFLFFPLYRCTLVSLFAIFYRPRAALPRLFLTLTLLLLPVTYIGSQLILYFDTAFYHIPIARIFEKFGVIKGMVLIHTNLGQVSSWFALSAPGTAGGENSWGAQSANVYSAMLAASHAAFAICHIAAGSKRLSDMIAGLGFLLVLLLASRWGMIASLSPDLPTMILVVAIAWFLSLESTKFAVPATLPVAAFALTIKLSAVPLAIIVGIAAFQFWLQQRRGLIVGFVISLTIAVPFAAMSILANGCLAFPAAITCFDLPWTPSIDQLNYYSSLIIDAARGGGRALPPGISSFDGFIRWASRDTSGAIVVVGGLLLVAILVGIKLKNSKVLAVGLWPFLLAATGIAYVAILAPTGRFGGGYTAVLASIVVFSISQFGSWARIFSSLARMPFVFTAAIIIIHMTSPGSLVRDTIAGRITEGVYQSPGTGYVIPKRIIPFNINQPDTRRKTKWRTEIIDGLETTQATQGNECWSAQPPCFPRGINQNIIFNFSESGLLLGMSIKSQE